MVQPFSSVLFLDLSLFSWQNTNWFFLDFVYLVLTDAIDKGDNRRLGKKPVFTSSQVKSSKDAFKVVFVFQRQEETEVLFINQSADSELSDDVNLWCCF